MKKKTYNNDNVEYALNKGINRFDTGFSYGNFKSQPLLAKCLKKKLKF